MKKSFVKTLAVLGGTLVVTACCGKFNEAEEKRILTPEEKAYLSRYYDKYNNSGYDELLEYLMDHRQQAPMHQSGIFCDSLPILRLQEQPHRKSVQRGHAVSQQWEMVTGEKLEVSCGIKEEQILTVHSSNADTYISVEQYTSLLQSVKTCNTSKVRLSLMLDEGLLTEDKAKEVEKVILQCHHDKLREELNK